MPGNTRVIGGVTSLDPKTYCVLEIRRFRCANV